MLIGIGTEKAKQTSGALWFYVIQLLFNKDLLSWIAQMNNYGYSIFCY